MPGPTIGNADGLMDHAATAGFGSGGAGGDWCAGANGSFIEFLNRTEQQQNSLLLQRRGQLNSVLDRDFVGNPPIARVSQGNEAMSIFDSRPKSPPCRLRNLGFWRWLEWFLSKFRPGITNSLEKPQQLIASKRAANVERDGL